MDELFTAKDSKPGKKAELATGDITLVLSPDIGSKKDCEYRLCFSIGQTKELIKINDNK